MSVTSNIEFNKKVEEALKKKPEDRNYLERYYTWTVEVKERDNYDEGEEIFVYDKNEILSENSCTLAGDKYPDFIKEAAEHFGEHVIVDDGDYILIGISYTYLDYYYTLKDKDGNESSVTCVAPIEFKNN